MLDRRGRACYNGAEEEAMRVEEKCIVCGAVLTQDEVAMTRKLINRGATQFQCIPCLARHFEATEQQILERMQYFKDMGCTLFEQNG